MDDLSLDLFSQDAEDAGAEADAAASVAPPDAEEGREGPGDPPRVWTVSQVNRAVRSLLESAVDALWVGGEIGQWTRSRAGHCYFTLKDERAQLRCVMFAREANRLPTDPDEGMEVRVFGRLTLYEARGEYQLVAQRLEAVGAEGLWRIAFEKLRARLEAEGLLEAARKRPLPRFPRTVAVVTSPTGAALRDVVSVLRRRAPWLRLLVVGTRVQGEGASAEIAAALQRAGNHPEVDVVILARGGGSLEDLWAFNEEPVARAVAACPVPVVAGVGHEVDVSIADLVADHRAPTPTAAAEAVAPDRQALLESLAGVPERLGRGLRATVERRQERVAQALERLGRSLERRLEPLRISVDRGMEGLERSIRRLLERRRNRLAAAAGRLEALSPLATLRRGYAVARDDSGRVLRSVRDFAGGRPFRLTVQDGDVPCRALTDEAS